MGTFFDNWAWAHRNARAWGAVIALTGLLLWALWETRAERIEYREISGKLLEITPSSQTRDTGIYLGRVRLEGGQEIKLYLPPQQPHPQAGDRVPLIFERYDDGKVMYSFDNGRWLMDGGATR
jgi:hypothetical protein